MVYDKVDPDEIIEILKNIYYSINKIGELIKKYETKYNISHKNGDLFDRISSLLENLDKKLVETR